MSPEEAKKFAEEHTTESEPGEPKKDDSAVSETMESCIKATPERCRACVSNAECPRSCANIEKNSTQQKMFAKKLEFPIEQAKAESEKKVEEPKSEATQLDPEGYPLWKHPIFKKGDVEYTIYFEKQENGNYNVVFSDIDAHGGKVLWAGVVTSHLRLMALEHSLAEHITGW